MVEEPNGNAGRRPTLRDVGERAGVSFKSVSRVVNNESGVSEAMREKVERAIAQLGYSPDNRAKALRSASSATATVGFVQADVRNPFHAALLRGLEDVLDAAGYVVLSGSTDGRPDRVESLVGAFVARRVDGLVIVPTEPLSPMIERERERGLPIVCVDVAPSGDAYDTVLSDNHGGAEVAVRHLLARGHRRIGFLGDAGGTSTSQARVDGYRNALAAEGVPIDETLIVRGIEGPEEAQQATQELLMAEEAPTAIFSAQNLVSYGALKTLHHMGLQHRVAFVGFDDVAFSDVLAPAVTVVPQDPFTMGHEAGGMLLDRLSDPGRGRVLRRLPVSLVPRGSGEIPGPANPMYAPPQPAR